MNRIKVVKGAEVIKGSEKIFEPIKERVVEVVLGVLQGMKRSLEEEMQGIGLLVMRAVMELEITKVAGEKGKHRRERTYNWWGSNRGSVVLDGARVPLAVPRVVEHQTQKAYALKSYGLFRQSGELVKRAYRDLIRGISTRRYEEGVSQFLEGYGASAATVSRRMAVATARKVKELLERRFEDLDIAVLMIDGVQVAGQTVVIALGIDTEGAKHVLGLWQGSTENARVATSLLEDLVSRGLDPENPLLVVIDGSKALRKAVDDVLGTETPVQRCTVHKKRNVLEETPKQYHAMVSRRMTMAYNLSSADDARAELLSLAKELETINPSAARSLLEGLEETLTLHRLGVPDALRKSLQSTNIAESAIAVVRNTQRNVKRWRNGKQRERWVGAGLLEAEKNFRHIKGYGAMKQLIDALICWKRDRQQAA
jgi:transposase-like protein